ncbi:MAG: hypothetical protein A2Y12_01950 [Planctomycetes bacterium GWF2_42_9]|nr:MAG: hypothetical protein A2Y12_01950 [Planctomycetes bacterium GWF2_42_9]
MNKRNLNLLVVLVGIACFATLSLIAAQQTPFEPNLPNGPNMPFDPNMQEPNIPGPNMPFEPNIPAIDPNKPLVTE